MTNTDPIREQVFEWERRRWARVTAPPSGNGLVRLLDRLFGRRPAAEGIYLVEHDAVEPATLRCVGPVRHAWRFDHEGLRPVDPAGVNPGELIDGKWWRYQIVRLFIAADGKRVVLNEVEGPERVGIVEARPRESKGRVRLGVHRLWRARWRDELA
jgi:hypothetical protein